MTKTRLGVALIIVGLLCLAEAAVLLTRVIEQPPDQQGGALRSVHFKVRGGNPEVGIAVVSDARPLFVRSAEAIQQEASLLGRADVPDLRQWWRVDVAQGDAAALAERLKRDPRVVSAFVAPEPEVPVVLDSRPSAGACPIRTPSYESYQGYLSAAPAGIGAPIAWSVPGGRGEGIWVADVEFGWDTAHEDLPGDRMQVIGASRDYRDHGTAVVGELAAKDNGLGMVGIVPEVEKVVVSSALGIGAAAGIDRAQAALRAGDVLLIEMHAHGPRGRFLPMEYWDDVFDVVSVATARGIVVVAAAGNGAEDLDHRAYRGKLDRRVRDSGAILVGAGAPQFPGYVDRSRLDFSNYGSRVDVQGWGREVATAAYGDLQDCDAQGRRYTQRFGGTSSASPIVTGAAVAIQGALKAAGRRPLEPRTLRELLVRTGSPQTNGPDGSAKQHIGPRPDLARALAKLGLR